MFLLRIFSAHCLQLLETDPIASLGSYGSVKELREAMDGLVFAAAASGHLPVPDMTGVKQEQIQIPVRDGASIRAVLCKPENPQGEGPVGVFYHAGGWVGGRAEYNLKECIGLASNGCIALTIDYRMAPEHPFPTAINDGWDAFKWVR